MEYNYEIVYNGILDYPDFYLVNDFNVAVEQARLTVSAPDTIGLRYFPRNIEVTCYFEQLPSGKTYSWFFSNIPSFRKEPFSPPITEISPSVLLAPGSFKLKDKWGNAISWNSFGSWVYELLNGRAELGEETRQKVNNLTSGVSDTLKKIQILYQYLQDKTRYTSIQIGLGGWQPIMASEVDRLGYGDCKALTNYMLALLKAAGVNSYYTLVNSGENEPEIITAFPSQQFDHVILCVPLKNDSLWLECTSQDIPMGYLGTFTDDRSVLLIKEEGGFICHTPVYNQKVNIQSRVSHVQLQENGSAVMTVKTISRGLFYDKVSKIMHSDETDKRKKITERIPITNSTLKSFDLKEDKAFPPGIEETLNLTIQKIGVAAGDLTLVVPNQMTREDELSTQVIIKRKNPVEIRRSTLKTDTTYYTLPDELTFTGNHINETITSTFGEYRAVTSLKGQTIQYIRNLVVYKGVYQPELYEDFLGFFEKIAKADAKKLALKPAR
ncbi:MAG: transglutaminase-like domain-containing protein [Bacteroidetes bacterium]|nr:transglutaminase-like domain-containing protein [Bacteroidota bacterium]